MAMTVGKSMPLEDPWCWNINLHWDYFKLLEGWNIYLH